MAAEDLDQAHEPELFTEAPPKKFWQDEAAVRAFRSGRQRAPLSGAGLCRGGFGSITQVVKCVSHQRLLPHILAHAPDVKIIFLLRHPCGSILSDMKGQALKAVINHRAVEALAGQPNARIVLYEDLCADPISQARSILAWAGDWFQTCEAFLRRSLSGGRGRRRVLI